MSIEPSAFAPTVAFSNWNTSLPLGPLPSSVTRAGSGLAPPAVVVMAVTLPRIAAPFRIEVLSLVPTSPQPTPNVAAPAPPEMKLAVILQAAVEAHRLAVTAVSGALPYSERLPSAK